MQEQMTALAASDNRLWKAFDRVHRSSVARREGTKTP